MEDDIYHDTKIVHVLKCQVEDYVMFIEYGAKSFEPTIDLCEHAAPFLSAYFLRPDVQNAEEKNKKVLDANLHRFQRALVLDLKKNTISIISGKAGYSDSYGVGRMGQIWYFGTNRNYGLVMLGTRPFPHAPRSRADRSSYFVQETFFLPAGKIMTFDAALFMPAHSLGRHLNREGDGVRSARVHHWPEICASVLKAVDPTIAMVEQEDGDNVHTRAFLSRPFVLTSAGNIGPSSSSTRLQFWLDFCQASAGLDGEGVGVPRVHVFDTLGGPQRHWNVDDDYNADVYSAVHGDPLSKSNDSEPQVHPNSCEMERRAPPSGDEQPLNSKSRVRRACGALHSSQSQYSAQSPCDVQRVHHLQYGDEAAPAPAPMPCLEDVLRSPHLRPEAKRRSDVVRNARNRGKQVLFASSRGLADIWARDSAFAASVGSDRNSFEPAADVMRKRKERDGARDRDGDEGWWSRGESLRGGQDYHDLKLFSQRFNPRAQALEEQDGDPAATASSGAVHTKRLHRTGLEAEDGVGDDLMYTSAGMLAHAQLDSSDASQVYAPLPIDSLLDGRVEEFKELLRVVHAFGGMHRTHSHGDAGPPPPQHLVVRSLLAPLMEFHTSAGTLERLTPEIEVAPEPGTGAVAAGRPSPSLSHMMPRMCVLSPRLLSTMKDNLRQLRGIYNEGDPKYMLNGQTAGGSPTKMLWEAHVEAILLTERQLRTSSRPSLEPDPAARGGVGAVEAQGGHSPSLSGVPLVQPAPSCRASFIGRGLLSHYNRLLVLTTLKQALLPLFDQDGSFICDGSESASATLYLCKALNIVGDEAYPRKFLAWKLRELVSLLSPAGPLHYALDAWEDTDAAASPLPHQLSSDMTTLSRKLRQMRAADPTGRLAAFEEASSGGSLVRGLHSIIDSIEGSKQPDPGVSLGHTGADGAPKPEVNLHLSTGDALIYLFVLPEQFLCAQYLVNRWHKQCSGQKTCFMYVKTHIVVVHAEETDTDVGGAGEAPSALDRQHWDQEMARDAQPSLRLALLQLREALERGALSDDLVVALVGMPAALSFAAPGTEHSSLVPAVHYGGEGRYRLEAPIVFSSAVPGDNDTVHSSDPRALAGTGWAVVDMLREVQSSSGEYLHYRHGGSEGVARALRRYQRLHPHIVATDPLVVFNKPEGNRRWFWMTDTSHPLGMMQAAKERALYLYAPNKERENNAHEGVVDVIDYSATAEDAITFNATYCHVVRAMAIDDREYLSWYVEPGLNALAHPLGNSSFGDPIRLGRWLWARRERVKCNQQKMRLLVLLWVGDALPPHPVPQKAMYRDRAVEPGREQGQDRGDSSYNASTGQPHWLEEEQQGGLSYSLAQTLTGANGYPNLTHEMQAHTITPLPLSPFGCGVFVLNHRAIADYVKKAKQAVESGMVLAATQLIMQLNRGFSLALDGNRDTFLQDIVLLKLAELAKYLPHFQQFTPLESYRLALQALHEHMAGRTFRHLGHNPYTSWDLAKIRGQPRPGYAEDHGGSGDGDVAEDAASLGRQHPPPGGEGSPHTDPLRATKRVNSTNYNLKRLQYGASGAVGGDGNWGERGGDLASRLLSSPNMVAYVPDNAWSAGGLNLSWLLLQGQGQGHGGGALLQEAEATMPLTLGEGRGPDAGPPIEHYVYEDTHHGAGSAAMYFARAHEHRLVNKPESTEDEEGEGEDEEGGETKTVELLEMPSGHGDPRYSILTAQDVHIGPGGVGREALGNIFASSSYSALAGLYAVTGPLHASVSSYAKSIAYADYYTVHARRRRWHLQRERQLALHQLRREAQDGPAEQAARAKATLAQLAQGRRPAQPFRTHYLTMASKVTDKLQNLLYTAQTSGLTLSVVGLDSPDVDGADAQPERPFDYADKVVAYYTYLSDSLRSGAVSSDDVVVLLDAYDVLLFPDARRIGTHLYEHSATPIMFCAENGVYPEPSSQFLYPHPPHSQAGGGDGAPLGRRYLNSGCMAGRAGQVFRMVQAAYDLRDSFKNDQQFYAKYALTHPDLVSLDYSSALFFTSHKSMSCRSWAVVTNELTFHYYAVAPASANDKVEQGQGQEDRWGGIGVLHANNLASNRVYHVAAQAYKQATDTHYRGPDGSLLLEAVWALADRRFARAARLLSEETVLRNATSTGGDNLLRDWLVVRHLGQLGPELVRLAAERKQCEYVQQTEVGAAGGEGLLGLLSSTDGRVSVPPSYRLWFQAAGHAHAHAGEEEEAVQCSYVVHLSLRNSLAAVNRARFDAGLSQLPTDARSLVCAAPSSLPPSPSCEGLRDRMGSYGPGDDSALDLLQATLGAQGEEYMWEASGAAFELQQRRLADLLRVNVDKCE